MDPLLPLAVNVVTVVTACAVLVFVGVAVAARGPAHPAVGATLATAGAAVWFIGRPVPRL
jgi:hypothetical protein